MHGATAIEMALVLPILLLLVFGIIECGRVMMVKQILVNTAREATRRAIVPGATDRHIHEIILGSMDSAGIQNYQAHVELDNVTHDLETGSQDGNYHYNGIINNAQARSQVAIQLSVLHSDISLGPMSIIAGDRRITAFAKMRKE